MKIKHKKVSSFLQARRKERMNLSICSNDLNNSHDFSFGSGFELSLSMTERETENECLEKGTKTERISILQNVEELRERRMNRIDEENKDEERFKERGAKGLAQEKLQNVKAETSYEEKMDKGIISTGNFVVLSFVAIAIVVGGLVFFIRKSKTNV